MTKLTNEARFLNLFRKQFEMKMDRAKPFQVNNSIQSSVDYLVEHRVIKYLFEIDSYNMSKPIFGQYVLTDDYLRNRNPQNHIFVAIHFYKKFNKVRTIKYLQFARDSLNTKLPFVVFEAEEFTQEIKKHKDLDTFLRTIKQLSLN